MTGEAAFPARICAIHDEAEGVRSFVIEREDGSAWPEWTPGGHLDLALCEGLNRQYSLCGNPADRHRLQFAVLREPASRGGSTMLHEQINAGDRLAVLELRNHFPLIEADRYLLVAGGIGITPLLAMARELDRTGKDWTLLYGGRTRRSMAFVEELRGFGDRVQVRPQDEFGLLDLAGFLGEPEAGNVAYCCGPEALLQAVEAHCAGWPDEALQIERFHPRAEIADAASGTFEVELRRSGMIVTVPANKSIADTLEDIGVHIPRSCNEGTCGTCITKVIEGTPDHRDAFLRLKQRAENKRIMACCSRSLSPRIVLDI